jgi:hypothetical protein
MNKLLRAEGEPIRAGEARIGGGVVASPFRRRPAWVDVAESVLRKEDV